MKKYHHSFSYKGKGLGKGKEKVKGKGLGIDSPLRGERRVLRTLNRRFARKIDSHQKQYKRKTNYKYNI